MYIWGWWLYSEISVSRVISFDVHKETNHSNARWKTSYKLKTQEQQMKYNKTHVNFFDNMFYKESVLQRIVFTCPLRYISGTDLHGSCFDAVCCIVVRFILSFYQNHVTSAGATIAKASETGWTVHLVRLTTLFAVAWMTKRKSLCSLSLYSLKRRRLISIGIPIINLRRSSDRLRFIMGIPIPVRRRLLSE